MRYWITLRNLNFFAACLPDFGEELPVEDQLRDSRRVVAEQRDFFFGQGKE